MRNDVPQRKALAFGLERLNEDLRTLADLSALAIRKAMDSLQHADATEAEEVATLDREIYGLQLSIEKSCIDLIALHAPVARDLRTITTCLEVTTDLDRVGRYALDIAEMARDLAGVAEEQPPRVADIIRMGDLTIHMVDTSIRALINRDAESVKDMAKFDDTVDDLHDEVFKDLVRLMQQGELDPAMGARYVLVNRNLERIADHAVNIGQRVVYMVTGERPRRISTGSGGGRPRDTTSLPS
jgi:phosphate transport system protein